MNFFKKAQEFADTGIDHTAPPATAGTKDAGFGGLMSTASDMFKAQNAPTENAAPATSPGGRAVPTNEELMESSQVNVVFNLTCRKRQSRCTTTMRL